LVDGQQRHAARRKQNLHEYPDSSVELSNGIENGNECGIAKLFVLGRQTDILTERLTTVQNVAFWKYGPVRN